MLTAAKLWKLYVRKAKEFKADEITKQFFDYDNAIIMKDDPGQPLMVLESSDSCKYFDVNARFLNSCQKVSDYHNNDYLGDVLEQGSVVKRRKNISINLDKYNE